MDARRVFTIPRWFSGSVSLDVELEFPPVWMNGVNVDWPGLAKRDKNVEPIAGEDFEGYRFG